MHSYTVHILKHLYGHVQGKSWQNVMQDQQTYVKICKQLYHTLPTFPRTTESFLSNRSGMHLRTLLWCKLLSCETPLHLSAFCLFSTIRQFLSSLSSDDLQGALFLCFISPLASKAVTDPKVQWTEKERKLWTGPCIYCRLLLAECKTYQILVSACCFWHSDHQLASLWMRREHKLQTAVI